jgi:hypothetical protein
MKLCNKHNIFNSTSFGTAFEFRNPKLVSYKGLALLQFAEDGNLIEVKNLIETDKLYYNLMYQGDWGRFENMTPILLSIINDKIEVFMYLMNCSKQQNEEMKLIQDKSSGGFTLFSLAYHRGSLEICKFLLHNYHSIINISKDINNLTPIRSLQKEKIMQNRSIIDFMILKMI